LADHERLAPLAVLEEEGQPLLREEPLDELEVGLAVLHADLALRAPGLERLLEHAVDRVAGLLAEAEGQRARDLVDDRGERVRHADRPEELGSARLEAPRGDPRLARIRGVDPVLVEELRDDLDRVLVAEDAIAPPQA